MSTDVTDVGVSLRIEGRFDLMLYDEFHAAYSQLHCNSTKVSIDLSQTEYLDSSALGMLLMLRDHFDSIAEITLINPQPQVARILAIANFDKLFSLRLEESNASEPSYCDQYPPVVNVRYPQSESN